MKRFKKKQFDDYGFQLPSLYDRIISGAIGILATAVIWSTILAMLSCGSH